VSTPEPARPRVVLLGASNLTRGISTVIETSRQLFASPLRVLAALGHGRSYGMRSSILLGARSLPAIVDCGIWNALDRSDDKSNFALITDIGNDLIYGASPEQIEQWIGQCIDRLQRINATIAMTAIPIESIRSVTRWQFAIVKTLMYPTRKLEYEQARQRAEDLHQRINALAHRRNIALVPQRREWYGFDPIHVRYRDWPNAWAEILRACALQPQASPCAQPSVRRWAKLRSMTPEQWWLMGIERRRSQPAGTLADGTTISLF
jgi:hypothetical protein